MNNFNEEIRKNRIKEINDHSWDNMHMAQRRDKWFVNNLTDLHCDINITDEQLKEIKDFWKPYEFAYKNDVNTQIAFYKLSGIFDPSYIGFGLQRYSLVRFWNNPTFSVFRNKLFSKLLFPFVKTPKNYIENNYGVYIDEEYNILNIDEAVNKVLGVLNYEKSLILKPALDSGSGEGITFLYTGMSFNDIKKEFARLKENFVCQKIIKNHSSYQCENDSLNTLRVVTLMHKNKVLLVGTVFRMGVAGKVDNWGHGGIICKVDENGVCGNFAVTETGKRYYKHPNGFEFNAHKLYKADKVQKIAIECHKRIPQQKYISWDFTVDDKGEIVFIEMNSPGGTEVLQVVGFNAYVNKNIAKEILDEYMIEKFFVNKANLEWDYREFSDHVSLLKYAGGKNDIIVPDNINEKEVRIVYSNAFDFPNVSSITISKKIYFDSSLAVKNKVSVIYKG